ncbi:hypothetical protein B5M09_011257 [Aphanomyces astaci]|uniref:HTH CENPB-type domain-containing protein n=1 Tax=Aphanomyces astaci TaxID=112090 RepID=A0A3R7YU41_APHAT|nr:hypothetical protein B5M09_011257 [Aphanomyces astaci]
MEATVAPLRTGPPPSLPTSYEDDLVTWILGMETDSHAVGRKRIIQKATAILEVIHGFPPPQPLTRGWYHRFMARHPELKRKKAQTLSAARSAITPDKVVDFYHQLAHSVSQIADDIRNDIGSNVTKQKAVSITCEVWANSTKTSTIVNGFASTGLFPPSLDAMMYRLSLFNHHRSV